MALLVKNGEIVTVGAREKADIFVENETITRIGKDLDAPPGAEIVDAAGKLVFPGFIDPHVHIYLPFMSTFAKDTHAISRTTPASTSVRRSRGTPSASNAAPDCSG